MKNIVGVVVVLLYSSGCAPVGEDGRDGSKLDSVALNGTLTQLTGEARESDCPNGGVTLEHGIDSDGDGTLSSDEVLNSYVLCHGKDGANVETSGLRAELDALKEAVDLNTAKVGISTDQLAAIAENSVKLGYSEELVAANAAVVANTAKVGISPDQSADIDANTAKVGYSNELVAVHPIVTSNAAKVAYSDQLVEANPIVLENSAKLSFPGFGLEEGKAMEGNTLLPGSDGFATKEWVIGQEYGNANDIITNSNAISDLDLSRFGCAIGYAGEGCTYSDVTDCTGNGQVSEDGICTCALGWEGESCTIQKASIGEDCTAGTDCVSGRCSVGSICAPEDMPVEMTFVPAGEFIYGPVSSAETLTTNEFFIDISEVTAGDYKSCVDAGVCNYIGYQCNTDPVCTYDNTQDNHPINYVLWEEAVEYCTWKGKRLPTEFEWEKAARGTDGRVYPWGDQTPICLYSVMREGGGAGISGCGNDSTSEVGQKPDGMSPYGADDMAGNVWEYTNSWKSDDQLKRVARGGSYTNWGSSLESTYRLAFNPIGSHRSYGFRCAQ